MEVKEPSHMLEKTEQSLPKQLYFDVEHFEKELDVFWFRKWLYVCRSETLEKSGDYQVFEIGGQSIVIVRGKGDKLSAFHNTCRHRGSILTTESKGCFKGCITCPYHAWTYDLDGQLIGTPHKLQCDDFNKEDYSLFHVGIEQWEGCVFVNLNPEQAPALREVLEGSSLLPELNNWNLRDLRSEYYSQMTLNCNWKIFWENFSECFHCPGVHPEFCDIVPIYGRGLLDEDPAVLKNHKSSPRHLPEPGFRPGAVSWTLDGQSDIPAFPDLTEEEKSAGFHYFTMRPGFIVEALRDCVVLTRILPLGPEKTEIIMEILFSQSVPGKHDDGIKKINEFLELVMLQDCRICEINQKGLRSNRFTNGVLVPQEYGVHEFQQWILRELGEG